MSLSGQLNPLHYPTDQICPNFTTSMLHRTGPLRWDFQHNWFLSAVNSASTQSCWTSDAFFGKWNHMISSTKQRVSGCKDKSLLINSVFPTIQHPKVRKTLWSISLANFLYPWKRSWTQHKDRLWMVLDMFGRGFCQWQCDVTNVTCGFHLLTFNFRKDP